MRKTTVNMKVSEFCYEFFLLLTSDSRNKLRFFPTRIKIIHGNHSLFNVLTWVTLFSLHFIPL